MTRCKSMGANHRLSPSLLSPLLPHVINSAGPVATTKLKRLRPITALRRPHSGVFSSMTSIIFFDTSSSRSLSRSPIFRLNSPEVSFKLLAHLATIHGFRKSATIRVSLVEGVPMARITWQWRGTRPMRRHFTWNVLYCDIVKSMFCKHSFHLHTRH